MGDYARVLEYTSGGDHLYIHPLAMAQLGREREAIEMLRERLRTEVALPRICLFGKSLLALLEGRRADSIDEAEAFIRGDFRDPEGLYYFARQLSYLGEHERAVTVLREVFDLGYRCLPILRSDPWLDPLRTQTAFVDILRHAERSHAENVAMFAESLGDRVLLVSAG